MGHVTKEHLRQAKLVIASERTVAAFGKVVMPMRAQYTHLGIENQRLTELRDWLLPMLMNGQAKVG